MLCVHCSDWSITVLGPQRVLITLQLVKNLEERKTGEPDEEKPSTG